MIMSDKFAFGAPPLIACVLLVLTGCATMSEACLLYTSFVQELAQELVFAAQLAVGAAEKNSLVERGADAFGAGGDKESVDVHLDVYKRQVSVCSCRISSTRE